MQLRNLCPETQRNYVHHIAGLARFYQASPEHLSLEEIREYQLYLINERRRMPSISSYPPPNSSTTSPWKPPGRKAHCRAAAYPIEPVVLSATETGEFFQHVCTIRYRAALMTAYGAGLRVSEVVALQVGDIDSQRLLIRVRQGKGKKDRYAMLSPRLLVILRSWWRAQHPAGRQHPASPQDWLFPGWRKGRHMNTESLQMACREAARAAGLSKRVRVHTLRHSFATHMLENGTDIRLIQALLGHTRIDTTARYAAVSPNAIAAVRSPLDRLGQPTPSGPKIKARR